MYPRFLATTLVILTMATSNIALANCKKMIDETRNDIDANKDSYTLASRNAASARLAKADMKRIDINPLPDADCMKEVREARKLLRQDKK